MENAADFVRQAREESGLSLRSLASRADVSYTTICRIEHGRIDPTLGTLRKLLSAIGQDIEIARRPSGQIPHLADLVKAWTSDNVGQHQPDWTRLRAFLDYLVRYPEIAVRAIRMQPSPSGSEFFDNLLAGIAEKVADDAGAPRPAWTKRIQPLAATWESLGTPRMRRAGEAASPPQFIARGLRIPAASLWRHA